MHKVLLTIDTADEKLQLLLPIMLPQHKNTSLYKKKMEAANNLCLRYFALFVNGAVKKKRTKYVRLLIILSW